MPQISLIIPVYNTELYLPQCLDSVLAQTFGDLEVICVNDGSTDGSAAVLQAYAAKDPRVKVCNPPHGGLGMARNHGLEAASGKYVLFLDSDDFLAPNACEVLYNAAEKENLEVVSCEHYIYNNETHKSSISSHAFTLPSKANLDAAHGDTPAQFAAFAFASPFAWGKLFRRDKIEALGMRFPTGAVEDVPFTVAYLVNCARAKRLEKNYLFYYRVARVGNLSSKNEKMLLDGIKNLRVLEETLKKQGLFERVAEIFWFNKMVLLIGDERLFVGRLGNVSPETVQKAYDLIRKDILSLDTAIFAHRNAMFRWKVAHLVQAVQKNDLHFPRRLRKLRNLAMIFLDPWYKLTAKK